MQNWNTRTQHSRTCAQDSHTRDHSDRVSPGVRESTGETADQGSHTSCVPSSSDRLARAPKSVWHASGKKPGGHPGHCGHHLQHGETPDAVLVPPVGRCKGCQENVHTQPADQPARRQVFDVPPTRLWVTEQRVGEKPCPQCLPLTRASVPAFVKAPAHYPMGWATRQAES